MICNFKPGEETQISEMINRVFDEFIGPEYSEKGRENFRTFADPQSILERNNLLLTYKIEDNIVGMIEVKNFNHICLFFVDPQYQNRGIGRQFMDKVKMLVKDKTDYITVNSSIYAENIYKSLGCKRVGELQEKDGIKFIPMKIMFDHINSNV